MELVGTWKHVGGCELESLCRFYRENRLSDKNISLKLLQTSSSPLMRKPTSALRSRSPPAPLPCALNPTRALSRHSLQDPTHATFNGLSSGRMADSPREKSTRRASILVPGDVSHRGDGSKHADAGSVMGGSVHGGSTHGGNKGNWKKLNSARVVSKGLVRHGGARGGLGLLAGTRS